ncbi:MAG: hypothetical protein NUW06_05695 [Candidatus Acetothermia bacterium]|jgi:hypothetical protein|nr:hypothetical protein [Candidatus Acetothermia bacterium]MDH7505778.1 hypothetical protein [Candidatus Acetothermia bacterium]
MKRLLFGLVSVLVLCGSAQATLGQTISVQTASVAIDSTVSVPLTLDSAPTGLASFAITVTLVNGAIGEIENVLWPEPFEATGVFTIAPDRSSVTLLANDSGDAVQSGAANVELAELVLRGKAAGSSGIALQVNQLKDDGGAPIEVRARDGSLTVTGGPDRPPVFSNPQPRVNAVIEDSQPTISIEISDVGGGVNPDEIQMRVEDSSGSHSFARGSPGASWDGTTFSIDLAVAGISLAAGEITVRVTAADQEGHLATIDWSFTYREVQPVRTIPAAVAAHSGDPQMIEDEDIIWAIELWIEGAEVPGTGQVIADEEISVLIELWIEGSPVGS